MNAVVTMKFLIRDVCSEADFGPGELYETFDSLVRDLISEEGGILGLVEDEGTVIRVEAAS